MEKEEKTKKKRKLKFKGLLVILLVIYLVFSCLFYLWKSPIKKFEIIGNNYLKDNYIINYLNLDNTSILKVNKRKIKNKLLKLDIIKDVKIKRNILGKLTIDIEEDRVLFYNWNNKKLILTKGREVDYNGTYLGVPVLINYVPDDVYKELCKKLEKLDDNVLKIVSEIEYSRSFLGDKTIDDKRFLFRMNDGNKVYVNTTNMEKFNTYLDIYEAIVNKNGDVNGCLYLDSNGSNKHFDNCEEIKKVEDEDQNE